MRAQLGDRQVRAPFSGMLGIRQISPGALVTPGTAIATLDDLSSMHVDFPVPEGALAQLAVGQQVNGRTAAYPDKRLVGRVSTIDARVDPATRSVTVRADFPNPDRSLRPGLFARVAIELDERPDAVLVPEAAVVLQEAGAIVYRIVDGKGIYGDGFSSSSLRRATKRAFDVVVAATLMLATAPLLALTALAIWLESGCRGPILYSQERVGDHGRTFRVLKLRSMRTDAERDGVARWATSNDDRVTRVGRIIRKLRIDELPQLVNVLRGEMSFVGPRPERPQFVEQLSQELSYYPLRHSVKPGLTVLKNYPLEKLVPFIDWSPFFQTWELSGAYPAILEDPVVGAEATKLLADAQAFLKRMIEGRWVRASGVLGLFPAARVGDDIEVYRDESRRETRMTWHNLRQQNQKPAGRANQCLADYVAPRDSGVPDWIGAFAVTAGLGIEKKLAEFERAHDDYAAIMLKALADRLAEAFTEHLHERVRREYWGYAPGEQLTGAQLIAEAYRGIRPAPGYPACPDHTEKRVLFELLQAGRNAGITLTESCAMLPASAVSGFYLSHPAAAYFAIGRIGRDQVEDYARRKSIAVGEAERWLAPILAYEPADIIAGTTT